MQGLEMTTISLNSRKLAEKKRVLSLPRPLQTPLKRNKNGFDKSEKTNRDLEHACERISVCVHNVESEICQKKPYRQNVYFGHHDLLQHPPLAPPRNPSISTGFVFVVASGNQIGNRIQVPKTNFISKVKLESARGGGGGGDNSNRRVVRR
jgi:hypothetical protein